MSTPDPLDEARDCALEPLCAWADRYYPLVTDAKLASGQVEQPPPRGESRLFAEGFVLGVGNALEAVAVGEAVAEGEPPNTAVVARHFDRLLNEVLGGWTVGAEAAVADEADDLLDDE